MGNASSKFPSDPRVRKAMMAKQTDQSESLRQPRLRIPASPRGIGNNVKAAEFRNVDLDADARAIFKAYETQVASQARLVPGSTTVSPVEAGDAKAIAQERRTSAAIPSHLASLDSTILKPINRFARRHNFLTHQSLNKYTTSQRRTFERDIYDYGRSVGLFKAQVKASIIYARSLCGEEEYDSDDTRLDDDEIDDSASPRVDLPILTGCSSSAIQDLLSPLPEVRVRSQTNVTENDNARKRPSDASDDRGEKRRKVYEDTASSAPQNQPQTQPARIIVTWMEIKSKLLASLYASDVLPECDEQTADSLAEKISGSITHAARLLSREEMEGRPALLESLSTAFACGAADFFSKTLVGEIGTGMSLQQELIAHLDTAMAQWGEENQLRGQLSYEHTQYSEDQLGDILADQVLLGDRVSSPHARKEPPSSRPTKRDFDPCISESDDQDDMTSTCGEKQDTPARSDDSHYESNCCTHNASDQRFTAKLADSTADRQPPRYGNEGAEAESQRIESAPVKKDIERQVIDLVLELSQKYDSEELSDGTKTLLRNALESYERNHEGRVEYQTGEVRLLREKWARLIGHDSANEAKDPMPDQEITQTSGLSGKTPFVRYGNMRNAWRPWTCNEPTHSAAYLDITMSDLNDALNKISNARSTPIEGESRLDDIRLSEAEQSMDVSGSEGVGDPKSDEKPPKLGYRAIIERQEQDMVIARELETTHALVHHAVGPGSADNGERNPGEHISPYWNTPPIPSTCRKCGRRLPSGNALRRHRVFYHNDDLFNDATERDRQYRLYLHEDIQQEDIEHENAPLDGDRTSVQAQPSEGNGTPTRDEQLPSKQGMRAIQQTEQHLEIKIEEPETVPGLSHIDVVRRSSDAGDQAPPKRGSAQTVPRLNPLQCRKCNGIFASKDPLYEHLESIHAIRRKAQRKRAQHGEGVRVFEQKHNTRQEIDVKQENASDHHTRNQYRMRFSKSNDSARVTAADEDVPRQANCNGLLRLRGGGAVEIEDVASSTSEASLMDVNGDQGFSEMVPRIDDQCSECSKAKAGCTGLTPSKIMALVNIVKHIERAFAGEPPTSSHTGPPAEPFATPIKIRVSSANSSPLSSAPSSPTWPTVGDIINGRNEKGKDKLEVKHAIRLTPPKSRASSSKTSPYFLPLPKAVREAVSCIPFPPLSSTSFGLVQECLASNPFHLLIAVIFLNKTRGAVAMPVFYTFITRFPEPSYLAAADHSEVVSFFQNLGLQNQRAKKCIALAKVWLEHPPTRGKRWRRLHYPSSGDGKDIKTNDEPIADETEDARVGWEVGHLPGIGAYGIDSWRIFCRDELRNLGTAGPPDLTACDDEEARTKVQEEEMTREWTRVLPMDKELRAYQRWRWLRLGWDWDPKTGERREAEAKVVKEAEGGGVMCEGDQGWSLEKAERQDEIRRVGDLC